MTTENTSATPTPGDQPQPGSGTPPDPTRRQFLGQAALSGTALLVLPALSPLGEAAAALADDHAAGETAAVRLRINGAAYGLRVDTRTTLLDLLREHLDLTGTKKGCNHGQCGACTILVDGERLNACLALAVVHDGATITTIEGLASGDDLHPMQAAFITHDGFQCGYCTSGQICSAVAMLREVARGTASAVTADVRPAGRVALSDDEIKERMSGNICRCGAYPGIVAAIRAAAPGS